MRRQGPAGQQKAGSDKAEAERDSKEENGSQVVETGMSVGDTVAIAKLGTRTGELAVISKATTWKHGRITVRMQKDGSTKSYCAHELKSLRTRRPSLLDRTDKVCNIHDLVPVDGVDL